MEKFPFYNTVTKHLESKGINYTSLDDNEKIWHFVEAMLDENDLNYGNLPKGLLPFHKYNNDYIATAFEEHLHEAALYSVSNNEAHLHFTISPSHKQLFIKELKNIKSRVEKQTGVAFQVAFSYQETSTDTIAVKKNNQPFRDKNGQLLFRPSGHGALLKNLNAINADLIFVKNIDNVVVEQYRPIVAKYKKVLAGKLLYLQQQCFRYLRELHEEEVSKKLIVEISYFLANEMQVHILSDFYKYTKIYKIDYLKQKLNRPIRVCGMVKNEDEPGGGPFWVKDDNGQLSLQIVESAQINLYDKIQKRIFKNATHFNPVDMVCGVKNYLGEKFHLEEFVDHEAAFITLKTKGGKDIKALELPGLWNGSMAKWNTIFVEVPISTFSPVKKVNDLLKESHQ